MGEQVQRIELPDGTEVWARLSVDALADGEEYGDYEDVGALDGVVARVQQLRGLITGVAASVRDAAAQAAPDEVSVEFGVELAVKSGAIVSVLADGESRAALTVTLTWRDRFGREGEPPRPEVAHPRSSMSGMPGIAPMPPTPPSP
ncbi:CU044_2847 family protein [Streptomyces sp. NPDC020096]